MLREVADSPAIRRQQAVIERQSRHTARLLDDLLDVSRITQGRIELRKQHLDLVAAVEQAGATCRPSVEEHGHHFTVSLPAEPVYVEADPARLQQILTNLLTNAAKYTPAGGSIHLSVEVDSRRWMVDGHAEPSTGHQPSTIDHQPVAVIRVRDTGIGISPELLPRVFDLFTQAERSLDRSEGGVGIGLTMVKRLVLMHGGAVEAHSLGPGRGSEFVVRLPTVEARERGKGGEWEMDQDEASSSSLAASDSSAEIRRVLLVEDNRDAAETLRDLLELWGHVVCVVASGKEGLDAIQAFQPDVVLLDIGLPEMDGYEVAGRLRSEPGFQAALVALSGYGQDADRRRSEEAGFDHHLTKPIDPEELRRLLSSVGSAR